MNSKRFFIGPVSAVLYNFIVALTDCPPIAQMLSLPKFLFSLFFSICQYYSGMNGIENGESDFGAG